MFYYQHFRIIKLSDVIYFNSLFSRLDVAKGGLVSIYIYRKNVFSTSKWKEINLDPKYPSMTPNQAQWVAELSAFSNTHYIPTYIHCGICLGSYDHIHTQWESGFYCCQTIDWKRITIKADVACPNENSIFVVCEWTPVRITWNMIFIPDD